jgi:ABC-type Fe3+-hydroxamate transport system substrate-binding protein
MAVTGYFKYLVLECGDRLQELTILGYGYTESAVNLEKVLLLKPDLILGNQDHEAIYN